MSGLEPAAVAITVAIVGGAGFLFWYSARRSWNVGGEDDARRTTAEEDGEE